MIHQDYIIAIDNGFVSEIDEDNNLPAWFNVNLDHEDAETFTRARAAKIAKHIGGSVKRRTTAIDMRP